MNESKKYAVMFCVTVNGRPYVAQFDSLEEVRKFADINVPRLKWMVTVESATGKIITEV